MEGKRLEDYKKINKWIEVHWKIVLIVMAILIPILVYKISVKYAIKDIISANQIFTGLITFFGILISFFGIYWKTTREEANKSRGIYSVFLYSLEKNSEYQNTDFFEKLMRNRYSETNSFFHNIDSDFINKNLESILIQDFGSDLMKFYTQIENFNKNIKKNNKSILDKIKLKIDEASEKNIEIIERHILLFILAELGVIIQILSEKKEPENSLSETYFNQILTDINYSDIFYTDSQESTQDFYDFKLKAINIFISKCMYDLPEIKNIFQLLFEITISIEAERIYVVSQVKTAKTIMKLNGKYLKAFK